MALVLREWKQAMEKFQGRCRMFVSDLLVAVANEENRLARLETDKRLDGDAGGRGRNVLR
jgi:hypothetical protein